eukprot:TRINITY_DN38814_c0_g2_i1.p1 TRINITY_DN38814_c0_g2~~TRINITY_DN38814_c0_g2_i1.p1  ORF type:complete len:228 (-),score=29.23 TRINITY_DN38814_c0_g2_i1:47-730(-)
MMQLKKMQAKAKEAESAPAPAPESETKSGDPPGGLVIKRQDSKELAETRKQKSKENIMALRSRRGRKGGKKTDAYKLRLTKDISELETVAGTRLDFPNPEDFTKFFIFCKPLDGLYKGAEYKFRAEVPGNYPYDPPKITCETLIYHPNIDWEGHVCLNILRDDWRPVLNIGTVVFGLMTLFLEPNPDDPLNKDAATEMIKNKDAFKRNVENTLRGGYYFGRTFPKLR